MKPSLTTETVRLDEQTKELVLIDQTKLPGEYTLLRLSKAEDIWEAIVPVSYTHLDVYKRQEHLITVQRKHLGVDLHNVWIVLYQ